MEKRKRNRKRWIWILSILLLMLAIASALYISDYYHASEEAMNELAHPSDAIEIIQEDDRIILEPPKARAGMIFYPGGKVAYEAYVPLMELCAERGILCVIPQMPGNLAVLDQNAADGIPERFPQIKSWYLAGHSLGGTVAAIYLADHADEYDGLILLASYSTSDLSNTNLKVLSIYGSEDGVLNRKAYDENRSMLPAATREVCISGGCHAYFGTYGEQSGDGTPTITPQEQQQTTANEIAQFIFP